MAKPELEFFDVENISWEPVEGSPGIYERIVSKDPETGSYTRVLRFEPGVITSEILVHDFWEEVFILKGGLMDLTSQRTFTDGMYACRPPGMKHGPYSVPVGCITLEMRYYL